MQKLYSQGAGMAMPPSGASGDDEEGGGDGGDEPVSNTKPTIDELD
jgi:hypothetical protein